MMKLPVRILLLSALLCVLTSAQPAQRRPVRLKFPHGADTLQVRGTVKGRGEVTYLLEGRRGQRLEARLNLGRDDYAALQVRGPGPGPLSSEDGTDAGLNWSGVLKETGRYRITVFGPDTADAKDSARFRLEVTLK